MKTQEEIYYRVAEGLSSCQQVEFELKNYITAAHELMVKCLDGQMIFRPRSPLKMALESLIKEFLIYNDDKDLAKELREFADKRNYLAHAALMAIRDHDGDFEPSQVKRLYGEIAEVEPWAKALCSRIHAHYNKVIVRVYFEDETKNQGD